MEQKILVGGSMMGSINFAMQQNYVPIFRNIILTNKTAADIDNVKLRISFEPQFAHDFEYEIAKLQPDVPVEISPIRIVISPDYLYSLTEKMNGNVHVDVKSGDELLYERNETIELLAYDEWSGALIMPEIIAAFVTPNHPAVASVVSKASLYLQKWLGSPSFTGYQSKNPNIVKQQAAAIYAALQAENIAYTMPPASYEMIGQRVRLPHTVLEQKCGTCLDLSVIFASCLEAVGLNALIVFIDGHAFSGCWLESDTFAECVEDDISAITKRNAVGIDQLCLVECTDFVVGKNIDFDRAEKHADDNLLNVSDFRFVIDIMRCRGSGIRPMPTRIVENGKFATVDYGKRKESEITSAPRQINMDLHGASSESKEITRQEIWERKLLDLSLRNSLLNFRPTSSNVQFMTADLAKLEDQIAASEDFKVMPAPNDFVLRFSDSKIFEIENEKDLITAIAEAEFKSKRLRTFMEANDLEKTLKKLHRQAKISLEENGANTLYLALGFLRWFETEQSERPRYAPLVLVPVDIIRKIQDRSYSIRVRDEETQMNITLLELLRQDFGIDIKGLNPLPCDESGVDLPLIFNTVRQGVMSKKHWDIEEIAFLGQFSFSQFIMWNDIRNRSDDLKKNKVVASLISGKTEWQSDCTNLSPKELDEKVAPSEMAVPTSADSSQLAAIFEASHGESFVLHGPPGTGKSQTITNMIANALYQGKSVLFVAEKMAALSVVQKRLAAIGLDPFCLELHSNKSQKRAVLQQLEHTLSTGHIKSPEEFTQTADRIHLLRNELNTIISEMHKKRSIGLSLYDAVVMYERNKTLEGAVEITSDFVGNADNTAYDRWNDLVRKAVAASAECVNFKANPLRNYRNTVYSLELRDGFLRLAQQFSADIAQCSETVERLSSVIGIRFSKSFADYENIMALLKGFVQTDYLLENILFDNSFDMLRAEADKLIDCGKQFKAQKAELSEQFEPTVFDVDCDTALINWKKNAQKWFIPRFFGTKKLISELAVYAKTNITITKENIAGYYEKLCALRRLNEQLTNAQSGITSAFSPLWLGENTDFEQLYRVLESSLAIRNALNNIPTIADELKQLILIISRNRAANADKLNIMSECCTAYDKVFADITVLEDTYKVTAAAVVRRNNWYSNAKAEADGWATTINGLKERTALETALNDLRGAGLSSVADAYESGKITSASMINAYQCGISKAFISHVFAAVPELSGFNGTQFEDTVAKFKEATQKYSKLTIQELVARLSAKIPDTSAGTSGSSSELTILQKAIRSGGRMMPIRKLFDSIPTLLRRICPCMLMSPISVAQYIDPSFPKFDLVIFDEASQMPTCEAVGAIARGENVVVVGDPKQLPPTSFFTANQVDEENIEKEDLESVLDDCLALSMPQKHLLWHYRSRHESLIAYSNAKYYENKLRTFPSPDDLVSEVQWVNVEGYYDKGGTKQNKAEAQAIINEIVYRLNDEQLRKQSIGVVTFSVVQQNLIDDMLAAEFMKNPQLEIYANEMYEPILVKNLENVQGDERDVILFSVGYGPDKEGKVSMNFGPLNRDGGWRRLNVAISRSRKAMKVYSVIRPEQIDLSRTRSDGVAGLKGFLEFAAKGRSALAVRAESTSETENSFARIVAEELEKIGYTVKCGIGCSEYKIDIGIVNPDNEGMYILGIVLDGRDNFDKTTANDRNILQPSVLSGLGWNIFKLHTLDWFDNKGKIIEKLCTAVNDAIEAYRSNPEPIIAAESRAPEKLTFEREEVLTVADKCEKYIPYVPSPKGSAEQFYEASSKPVIMAQIKEIVECEAPISRKTVLKYVLSSWGISRSGSKVERTFDEAAAGVNIAHSNGAVFFLKAGQQLSEYKACRIPANDDSKRSLDDVSSEEIANAIVLILTDQISMQRADLIRETGKLFGFSRSGGVIETSVNNAIEYGIITEKLVRDENDRITLCE